VRCRTPPRYSIRRIVCLFVEVMGVDDKRDVITQGTAVEPCPYVISLVEQYYFGG
jgi:hypothetical protein